MKRTYSVAILSELRCEEEPEEEPEDNLSLLVDMPEDIVYTIVGKLRPKDVASLLATCRRLSYQASKIWSYHIRSNYIIPSSSSISLSDLSDTDTLRDVAHMYYLRKLEFSQIPCDYLLTQSAPWDQHFKPRPGLMYEDEYRHINGVMRAVLIGWIIEVVDGWLQPRSVLHLTVRYIDIFLSKRRIQPSYLQLIGIMALRIAADHYNSTVREVFVPSIRECIWISDEIFEDKEAVEIEKNIRSIVSEYLGIDFDSSLGRFEFGGDTSSIRSCLETPWAITSTGCRSWFLYPSEVDTEVDFLASFLTEIALLCYEFMILQPSLVAASAVNLARIAMGEFQGMPKIVRAVGLRNRPLPCFFSEDVLKCSEMLLRIWKDYYDSSHDVTGPQFFTFERFRRRHMNLVSEVIPPDDDALGVIGMKSPYSSESY